MAGLKAPLLIESDTMSLSSAFMVKKDMLIDHVLGAQHSLRGPAGDLLALLGAGAPYKQMEALADKSKVTPLQLNEFFAVINSFGALHVNRTFVQKSRAAFLRIRRLALGVTYASIVYRKPATPLWIAAAISRSLRSLVVAMTAVVLLVAIFGIIDIYTLAAASLFCFGLAAVSIWVHEATHVAYIRRAGHDCAVVQAGLRVGVLHPNLSPATELRVAISGPVAGVLLCAAVAIIAAALAWPGAAWISLIVSVFHLASFLPNYGDGAAIHKIVVKKAGQS